jgi:hypothetical protein
MLHALEQASLASEQATGGGIQGSPSRPPNDLPQLYSL